MTHTSYFLLSDDNDTYNPPTFRRLKGTWMKILEVETDRQCLHFLLSDGNDGKFNMDPRTGRLSCQALDRETKRDYTLTVVGTDSGSPQRSGSTRVLITVLDDNDNSPMFSEATYTATIAEDVAKGQTVMRVFASDPDQGPNGEVAYSLVGNDTEGFFSVNSTSGDIITSGCVTRLAYWGALCLLSALCLGYL